jgi:primosomal protein N'
MTGQDAPAIILRRGEMVPPGWDSLDAVNAIDSTIRVVTLVFWSILVVAEIVAFSWKKRATLFNVVALVAFLMAVCGEIGQFKYDGRRDVLYEQRETKLRTDYDEQLKKAREQSEQSATAAREAQSSAVTAKQQAASAQLLEERANKQFAELKEREAPRMLTKEQRQKFIASLRSGKAHSIIVTHAPDLESQSFADQLTAALTEAGWTIERTPFRMLLHSVPGVVIMVHDIKVPEPEAGNLQFAFKSIGIDAGGAGNENVVAGAIEMFVGPKNTVTESPAKTQ